MLTKKEYCLCLVDEFKRKFDLPHTTPAEDLIKYCTYSSGLAVALEYLGILTPEKDPEMTAYTATRGGIVFAGAYETDGVDHVIRTLSVRELIELLPEEYTQPDDEPTRINV